MNDQAQRLRQLVDGKTENELCYSVEQPQAISSQGTRVLAVTSGKGGVGKTNLTVNLAIALVMAGLGFDQLDAWFGLGIAGYILWSAIQIAREQQMGRCVAVERPGRMAVDEDLGGGEFQ